MPSRTQTGPTAGNPRGSFRARGEEGGALNDTVDVRNGIAIVALTRPEVHNAFNETLIARADAGAAGARRRRRRARGRADWATARASARAPTSTG